VFRFRCAVIAIVVGAAVSLGAQRDTTGAGEALLTKLESAYKTLDSLHIKVKWSARYSGGMSADDFPPGGPDTFELRMQRPNKLFVSSASRRDGEQSAYLVVSDGATLSYWRSWTNSFVQTKAPALLSGIARQLPDDAIGTFADGTWEAQPIVEWDLLADDRTPSMTKALGASGLLTTTGPEKLGGAEVNVIRLTSPPGALPFTIEQRYYLDAESYLLRGLGTSARGKHPENGRDFTVEMVARYELFTTRATFNDADFRFVAPRGARPVKDRRLRLLPGQ
jgi:outer membrane lipoprotein-sorting protein